MPQSSLLFLLVPEFSLYGFVPAIEALRIANQTASSELFRWTLTSMDGSSVRASSGLMMEVECSAAEASGHDSVVVCAGNHPLQYVDPGTLNWLRHQSRHGRTVMGLDSGSFLLAEAGLLDGYRATVHPEVLSLFQECYPEIQAVEALFVADRGRITCAGGVAALDLMLHMIRSLYGSQLAEIVAKGFVHDWRQGAAPKAAPILGGWDTGGDRRMDRLIEGMQQNIREPVKLSELADRSNQSQRQMERTVKRFFGMTPSQLYTRIRLDAARVHLFHGNFRIKEIADLCGFGSSAAFCRAFRSAFGASPLTYRRDHSFEELGRFRGHS